MESPRRTGECGAGAVVPFGVGTTAPIAHRHLGFPPSALHLTRGAEHRHRCGPRAVAEFRRELAQAHGIEAAILGQLDRWRSLAPQRVAVLDHYAGGRQFPPALSAVAP